MVSKPAKRYPVGLIESLIAGAYKNFPFKEDSERVWINKLAEDILERNKDKNPLQPEDLIEVYDSEFFRLRDLFKEEKLPF